MKKVSKNIEDTNEIAKDFINKLKPIKNGATVVGLYGDLGAGKTTFTQAIGKILKIKRKVSSPTFVILKKYMLPKDNVFKYFFHIDAYRLKNEKELAHLGWDEIIKNKENLIFVEWPEQIKKALPKKHYQIHIDHIKEGGRVFEIKI